MGSLVFQNPIVAGTTLVRQAIQSPDFVAGVSGWIVRYDGSAEFNNLNIRGSGVFGTVGGQRVEISNTGVVSIYDTSNNLVVRLDATGLLVQDPVTGAAATMQLGAGLSGIQLTPPAVVGHTITAAMLYGLSTAPQGDAWLSLSSPEIDGGITSDIAIFGENPSLGAFAEIQLNAPNVRIGQGPMYAGWGPVSRAYATTDSAAVTAETQVLAASSFTFLDGRAYRVKWGGLVSTSNAGGAAGFRVRKNNATGQILIFGGLAVASTVAGRTCNAYGEGYFRNNSGAPITCFIVLTLQNFDGGANTATHKIATSNRWMVIEDCGDTTAYDWGVALV